MRTGSIIGAASSPRTTIVHITMGLRSLHLRPQLRDLKKLEQQSSQSILGQEQSTSLDRRHRQQRTRRIMKNAPRGTATTTAIMAMKAGDPTNPSFVVLAVVAIGTAVKRKKFRFCCG